LPEDRVGLSKPPNNRGRKFVSPNDYAINCSTYQPCQTNIKMELAHIYPIDHGKLQYEKVDFFIAASGYQSRATSLAGMIPAPNAQKFMLCFSEENHVDLRKKNELAFSAMGFQMVKAAPDKPEEIEILIKRICNTSKKSEVIFLIDYSCMPRLWFASILDSITRNDFNADKITVFFSYTPKKFNLEAQKNAIRYLGPMITAKDHLNNNKPVALIAGLDNSFKSTMELVKKLNPATILAFVPENKYDPEYKASVLENNKALLNKLHKNNIINYEVLDPESINSKLTSRCLDLRLKHEVVIVPQGPKSFSLVSSLLSVRYPDIKLWEVITAVKSVDPNYGAAEGDPIVLKVTFCKDDEEEE